jgi:hypothetical protein
MSKEKVEKTSLDLNQQFDDQISLLKLACDGFDNWNELEAVNIALRLRLLLHDSLLAKIGMKNISFISTRHEFNKDNPMSYIGLVNTFIGNNNVKYIPALDDIPYKCRHLNFEEWWNEVIFGFGNEIRNTLTRRDIVIEVADTDGWAHVDKKIKKVYAELTRKNWLWLSAWNQLWPIELNKVERVALRQIAHEVIKTIEPSYSKKLVIVEPWMIVWGIQLLQEDSEEFPKVWRNKPCPCWKWKKYKYCHWK